MTLIEELSKKRNKRKRSLSKKIYDELTARRVAEDENGLYDRVLDEKNCITIIQNNLEFNRSEINEKFNKMRKQMIEIVQLNQDEKIANKFLALSETTRELGELLKS